MCRGNYLALLRLQKSHGLIVSLLNENFKELFWPHCGTLLRSPNWMILIFKGVPRKFFKIFQKFSILNKTENSMISMKIEILGLKKTFWPHCGTLLRSSNQMTRIFKGVPLKIFIFFQKISILNKTENSKISREIEILGFKKNFLAPLWHTFAVF